MNEKYFLLVFLIVILFNSFFKIVLSQNIEVNIPSYYNIIAGQKVSIPINIKNLEAKEIRVFLNIFPPYYEGISAYFEKNEIIIQPKSEAFTNLIISSPFDVRDKIVTYQIYLKVDEKEKTYRLNLNVIGIKEEIKVENFGINKVVFDPEDELKLFLEFRNTKDFSTSIKVKVEILRENEVIDTYEKYMNILRRSSINFTFDYKFTFFHKPGKYLINVYSYDEKDKLISRLAFEIDLREIKEIRKETIKEQSFFHYKIKFIIKNVGNIPQQFILEEEIPLVLKPFVVFESYKPLLIGNKAIWNITLNPQEEVSISYSILYWIPISIVSIVVTLIFFYFLISILLPKISKKYEKTEDIYKIKILVKNTTTKKMKNIEINDFVPLLFKILNFETLEPQIKKTRDGYNLTWKIRELRPKEELIISYSIKPLIEIIGEIKFPKPKVKYVLR